LEYLQKPNGGPAVLKKMGQPPFVPSRVPDGDMLKRLPVPLQKWVEVRQQEPGGCRFFPEPEKEEG